MRLWLRLTVELDLDVLFIDLLVRLAASINLKKDGKDKFPKIFSIPPSCSEGKHQQTPFQPLDRSNLGLFVESPHISIRSFPGCYRV